MTSLQKINIKKYLFVVCFIVLIFIIFLSGYKAANFLKFYNFATKPIISSFSVVQTPSVPGQPIRWVKTLSVNSVTSSEYLLAVPKGASQVKISIVSDKQTPSKTAHVYSKQELAKLAVENSQSDASLALAKRIEKERATGFFASLGRTVFNFNSLLAAVGEVTLEEGAQSVEETTLVDLAPAVEETTGEEITPEENIPPPPLEDSGTPPNLGGEPEEENTPVVDNSEILTTGQATTSEEVSIITEENISEATTTEEELSTTTEEETATTTENNSDSNSGGGGGGSGSGSDSDVTEETTSVVEPEITTEQATTTPVASSTDLVQVEYETPAPVIAEAETDTGKIVSVSSTSTEQEIITNVLAFTNIPEIYKVGQEDKIKIKWTNNGDQNVEFHAYDTDNNGKLDYVEWTVPHLSTQTFEIIFISKAFELDENKEIVDDIYDTVRYQDGTWATVPAGHYVRATFEKNLVAGNDMTIYAKGQGTITVFNENGTDSIGEFTVNGENTYKIYPDYTDASVYDLLFSGTIEVDYIVDPDACTGGATDPDCWSANLGVMDWGPTNVDTPADSFTDGAANTAALVALAGSYPAAEACDSLVEGGYDNWYLPAKDELVAGLTEYRTHYGADPNWGGFAPWTFYWSSTEYEFDSSYAYDSFYHTNGNVYSAYNNKDLNGDNSPVRCLRDAPTANTAPSATITTPGTWNSGDVTINYKIIDAESDTSNITQGTTSGIEYSLDNSTWVDATQGAGGDATTGLTSSPTPGTSHTFVWASATDLATTSDSTVYIRVRPNDGTDDAVAWATSTAFGIDNVAPPTYDEFTYNGHTYQINPNIVTGKTWGPTGTTGIANTTDGVGNTNALAALGSTYEAATAVKALSDGGYSDWFLPAKDELNAAWIALGLTVFSDEYWSSTENSNNSFVGAWLYSPDNFGMEGGQPGVYDDGKYFSRSVRAFRIKTGQDSGPIPAPTFGTITASSIVVNQPAGVTDSGSGLEYWRVRTDSGTPSSWIAVGTTTYESTPLSGNTQYTYDVQFKDAQGNVSNYGTSASETTLIPNVAPNAPTLISPANASTTNDTTPTLSANYSDNDADDVGTTNYRISTSSLADCTTNTNVIAFGTSTETASDNATTTWTPGSTIGSDATYYWCTQNDDGALTSSWTQMGTFILDTTPPTGTIALAGGATYSATTSPTITLTTNDASQYQLCLNSATAGNDCTSVARAWASYIASPTAYNFGSTGVKTLYVQFKDTIGNISATYSDSITIDTTPPTQSNWNPATTTTLTTKTPTITFDLNEVGDCFASTTDLGYDAMVAGGGINCTGDGTASSTCVMSDLGANGSKNIYLACQDSLNNKDSDSTNTDLIYTLSVSSGGGGGIVYENCTYSYSEWSACVNNEQTRIATPDYTYCSNISDEPISRACIITPVATSTGTTTILIATTTELIATTTATTTEIIATTTATTTEDIATSTPVEKAATSTVAEEDKSLLDTITDFFTTNPDSPTDNSGDNTVTANNENRGNGGGNHNDTVIENIVAILDVSNLITDNVDILGTTTEQIILGTKKILESPAGNAVAKTITTAGVVGGGIAASGALAINGTAVADLLFLPFKLWGLLLSVLGLKKRNRPWGTVYDSVTKQPIDPAYVTITNLDNKKDETSITDLDGRYGFLVAPGRYTLSANKTNYTFPSKKLAGQTADILYGNLYFGEEIITPVSGAVISKNIPLDPVKFDWNEFTKGQKQLMKFYSKREKIMRIVTDWIFRIGFVISLISLFLVSAPYNLIIFGLYLVLYALRKMGLKQKAAGSLTDKEGNPLSFAIIRVFDAELNVEITNKVANQIGRYYCLVNKGKYYVKIEKKNNDESYTEVLTSPVFEAENGIVNKNFVL